MRRRALLLLALLAALGLFWHYQLLARALPFDYIWDMDITAAQDVLLLNSGEPPSHLDHPTYVMNLLQAAEAGLMQRTGQLSAANLTQLAQAPQPLLGLAELTDKLRSLNALAAWLLVVLLAWLLWRIYPAQPALALLALPLLGLQAGPLYNAYTMRTELYSVLLLAVGLGLSHTLWQPGASPSPRRQQLTALSLGLLLGLALLNKIQALSLFLLLPAFGLFCYSRWQASLPETPDPPAPKPLSNPSSLLIFALSLLGFAVLAGFSLTAPALPGRVAPTLAWSEVLHGLPGTLGRLKVPFFWLGLIASGALALGLSRRPGPRWAWGLNLWWPFCAGTLLAFGLPLFSLLGHADGLPKGLAYTANLIHATVWIDASLFSAGANASAQTLSFALAHRPDLLLLPLAALLVLALAAWQQPGRRRLYFGLCATIGACLLTLLLGNRPLLRDTLWFELWCSWAGLLGLGEILTGPAQTWRPAIRALPLVCVGVIAANSLFLAQRESEAIYLYNSTHGEDGAPYDYFLTKSVYLRGDNPYARIFDSVFDEDMLRVRRAISQARDWDSLHSRMSRPFLNADLPLRSIGLLAPRFAAWQTDQSWAHFDQVPSSLDGSAFVALRDLRPHARGQRYAMDFGNQGYTGRLKVPGAPDLTLAPAFNQSLLLALPEADLRAAGQSSGANTSLSIEFEGKSRAYHLFRLESLTSLDQRKLAGLTSPPLAIFYTASVQPPDADTWTPELSKWLE